MRPRLPQDDISDHQRIEARLSRLEQAYETPTGVVALWRSGVAVPDGWLRCNGTTFSADIYPQLAALWATTTLPADPGLTGYVAIARAR